MATIGSLTDEFTADTTALTEGLAKAKAKLRELKPRRPMTADEIDLMRRLKRCRYLPGAPDKRFVMQWPESQTEITELQAVWLAALGVKKRKMLAGIK